MKARTKDESFIVNLYQEVVRLGDESAFVDRYVIGTKTGLQKKAVDTICVLLGQANFIKKKGSNDISITPHGIKLVKRFLKKMFPPLPVSACN